MLTQRLPRWGLQLGAEATHTPWNRTELQLILSPPSLCQAQMPGTNLSCGFYPQSPAHGAAHSLLACPFCHRQGWAVCAGAILSHGAFSAQPLLGTNFELELMWSDALWKPVTSSQLYPQHRLIWSEQAGFSQALGEPEQSLCLT